jgi:Tfp pilus assembly protein PilN
MKPVKIDFAKSSLRRACWHTTPMAWLVCMLGIVLCLSAIFVIIQSRAAGQALQAEKGLALKTQVKKVAEVKKMLITEIQANAINNTILQLNLPWSEMQEAIEAASTADVALLTLEPDAKLHNLKLTAEAKNSDDMLAYIERLKRQAFFLDVVLSKHEISEQDSNRPLRFQLDLQWSAQSTAQMSAP